MGDISHILKWNPDKNLDAKGTSVTSKDARLPSCKPVQPTVDAARAKRTGGETKREKASEVQPVPPVGVQRHLEKEGVAQVQTKATVSFGKSSMADQLRSPKVKELPDGRADTAMGSYGPPSSSSTTANDHFRSPKRQHLDPSVAMAKNHVDMDSPVRGTFSPQLRLGSPSSVSSSSSPPVASMSSASSRDALDSLTSKVVVGYFCVCR